MTEKSVKLKNPGAKYQVIYCRYFNRRFDNTRIRSFVAVDDFVQPMDGLAQCLEEFLAQPEFLSIDWRMEGWHDRAAHEHTPLREIPSWKSRLSYCCARYGLDFVVKAYRRLKG